MSLPFVPGHEVVGELLDDCDDLKAGQRVVLSSVSGAPRGGRTRRASIARQVTFGRCDRVTAGDLKPGLQTGYCAETGGGWSRLMLAHRSQLWPVPDGMGDDRGADRAARVRDPRRVPREDPCGGTVLVVGAGTVGILTLIAVKAFTHADHVIVSAKHQRQRAAASMAGADDVVRPEHAVKAVRRAEHAMKLTPERGMEFLLGGVDVAIECTGSRSALDLGAPHHEGGRSHRRARASPGPAPI